jgi:hypothetical protein
MKYITLSELVKMPTKRILAYKRKHFCGRGNFFVSNCDWSMSTDIDPSFQTIKQQIQKNIEMEAIIKEVLAHRPHIERK